MALIKELITQHIDIWTTAETEKKSGRGRAGANKGTVYGIQKLRALILELAVRGKLVPQDPNDEPASELLKRIQAEKTKLISEGKLKKEKPLAPISEDEKPFELPQGWEWVYFGEIAQHNSGKTLDKGRNKGILRDYITTSNLYWGVFELDNVKQMPIEESELDRCTALKGDLLICEGGEAGRAAVWTLDKEVCFQNHVHRARFYGNINPFYAYRYFEKLNATGEIEQYRKGVGISNMSGKALASVIVALPPVSEQHRIVAKVDALMALCDQLESQHLNAAEAHETLVSELLATLTHPAVRPELVEGRGSTGSPRTEFEENWQRIYTNFDVLFTTEASIDALKQTLLQLAVMGKLVPQDPNDEPASELLKRIQAEKAKLIAEGKVKSKSPSIPLLQRGKTTDSVPPFAKGGLGGISEDEKPFELPQGWEWVRIADIGYTQTGTTPNKSEKEAFGNDIPFIKPGDIYPNYVDYENEGLSFKGALNNGRIAPSGSLLMVCIGTIGKCNTIERDCSFNQQINSVTPFHLNSNYLLIACRAEFFQKNCWLNSSSTTLPILNKGKWEQITIPLPPLSEQHRIVAKVDELMALCDQLKTRMQQASQQQQLIADALVAQAVA